MIRVLLVDDQELIRTGLRGILRDRFGFGIVGELPDGRKIAETVQDLRPDVIVMDIRMPHVDGVEALKVVNALPMAPPTLVLTTFEDDEPLAGALRAGAAGFLLKGAPANDLQHAVRSVAEGRSWLDPAITGRVLTAFRRSVPLLQKGADNALTPREVDVLVLIGAGMTNAEIAGHLLMSEGTVKTHISHIFAKLDFRDRAAAIVYAFDCGLAQPGGL